MAIMAWSKNEIRLNLRNANPICPILFIYCWKWCCISYTIIFDLKKNPFSGIEEINNFESQPNIALATDGNGYHGLVEEGDTLVNVTPAIRIEKTDGHELLCNILILQDGVRDDESPFQVRKTRFYMTWPMICNGVESFQTVLNRN